MSEVTDLIMPVLRKIQSDVSDLRAEMTEMRGDVRGIFERMDAFEGYFTYTMGLTSRNSADIETIREEIKEMKRTFQPREAAP